MAFEKYNSVLVVDDSHLDRTIATKVILHNQWAEKVDTVDSGIDGLAFLNDRVATPDLLPQVILLDIRMPEMDGFEFLEHFVKLPEIIQKNCQVYILSSSIDQLDFEKAKRSSLVKGYIIKPLSFDKLQKTCAGNEEHKV